MATPVEAKTFIVTSTLDEMDTAPGDGVCVSSSGNCTLRAAIQEANALDGPDSIKLKTGLYMLTIAGISENGCATGDLDITDSLTIIGTGAKNTFINAGKIDRVFHIMGDVAVKMTNVTIQNGLATDNGFGGGNDAFGGAILNEGGTLKVTASTLSNNAAFANYVWGGAIYSQSGEVTVGKSLISNNLARGINQSVGGGISSYGATLTIKGSTLAMNSALGVGVDATSWGGGIWLNGGFVTVEKSTISNNVAGGSYVGYGGGICNEDGTLTVTGSTLSNNSAGGPSLGYGGGICNMDTTTVTGSTISNNSALGMGGSAQGGGICNEDGTLTVTGSKIYNNTALGVDDVSGGGICSQSSDVTVDSSTISGNAASGMPGPGYGGGISHMGNTPLTVQNRSKIIKNLASTVGGGIYTDIYDWSSSTDSTVAKNAPDDIFYD
jgi:CSLREA domain-containing protein